jgi:hypothetical protein
VVEDRAGRSVAPLPDNCFNFLYGFKIRGPVKGNDLGRSCLPIVPGR